MTQSKAIVLSSACLITGGIIISKLCFKDISSIKRFFSSFCYTCAACCITAGSTTLLRQTRLKDLSANYQITALLVSIGGTLGYRYELFCNQKLMPRNLFWKYLYPWTVFCFFPSIFICGYKTDCTCSISTFQDTSIICAVATVIGILLPKYCNDNVGIIGRLKNFISEYTSILIAGVGFGLILSKFVTFIIGYKQTQSIDLCFHGLVLLTFGLIVEDVRSLKEKTEGNDEYLFDALISSIPLYVDMMLIFLFVIE